MLTRIEIDGFKTFENFHLDLGPFLVIVGPNASGKSNLFDAIQLLSRLASADLRTAVKGLRGEPHELFRRWSDGTPGDKISLAVEVLLNPTVRDPWGGDVEISHTRIRYDVQIERRHDARGIERLVVAQEYAAPILAMKDKWRPGGNGPSVSFKQAYMRYRRQKPWLETGDEEGTPIFHIHQDGKAGRKRSAQAAEATVLSSITSAEFPHLFALREELRSWRFLQLDPGSLRRPSPTTAPEMLEPDGSNLATVLARIRAETKTETNPKGAIADIAADLAALIPGVLDVGVEEDRQNREYRVNVTLRDELPFSSRVVSDGTLRVLALLTMLHDPKHRGLVCFEEPENGVHPARLKALIRHLREMVTDPTSEEIDPDEPLSQMLLNSHSPVVLSALAAGDMMFADLVSAVDPKAETVNRKTRMRPVLPKDQGELAPGDIGDYVIRFEVDRYLSIGARES
ncbi:MAG: AAA family ATPase [Nitrospinae bacterium]|nr:AAA family ATPase [Nitrospinota bacterium]